MARSAREATTLDPKGLIRESYRIEGISEPECRSIFLDWAVSVPIGTDARALIPELLALHGAEAPDHPMTKVLTDGLAEAARTGRRGGRRSRTGG